MSSDKPRGASGRVITPVAPSTSKAAALSQLRDSPANEIVISRLINAPCELVFDAWLKHEHLAHWFGPEGFTITTHEIDVRTGGVWRFTMHGPDGVDYGNRIEYTEITWPTRITYKHSGDDDENEHIRFATTVTFTEVGGKTELTLRTAFATATERDEVVEQRGAIEGGKQTLGRLADYVESHLR